MTSALPDRTVHVWWAELDDAHDELVRLLDPVERTRLDAYLRPDDRRRFLLGCAISRIALGEYLAMEPARVGLERRCSQCGGPHGKVTARGEGPTGIRFSVTHGGGLVGVAFCRAAEVGLDVEPADRALDVDGLASTALSENERAVLDRMSPDERPTAFLRYWCRKEAVVKALGLGMRVPFRRLELSPPQEPPAIVAWPDRPDAVDVVQLLDLETGEGHQACLAIMDPSPVTVVSRRAGTLLRHWAVPG
ncbi:4'-phosphopantetheinyl transferase family protein [Streptomyces sp. 8N706]|uniref:4'-phosphopantetheinyl transferase family protein n=1 Tax=Streptomyces sp. 8N706 TaxID=3457416 RepID=UPI003FD1C01B